MRVHTKFRHQFFLLVDQNVEIEQEYAVDAELSKFCAKRSHVAARVTVDDNQIIYNRTV
jgi:hypothetical protein